jgi:aquaporin Z
MTGRHPARMTIAHPARRQAPRPMETEPRVYAAELLGTFVLVFVGTTSIVASGRISAPVLLVVAFGFGLGLLGGLYAFGEVSGGHYNPAVSIAMFLDRRLNGRDLAAYLVAQFAGAVLAALILLLATTQADVASTATKPSSDGTAWVIEFVMTTIFVLVILQSTRSERFGPSALTAIPLTLVAVHLAAIPFSGSSVNPARTFGPDLVGNTWTGIWIYFTAPPLGAALAWLIHSRVVAPAPEAPTAPVAEVLGEDPEPAR